jgi:ClpP class serine protease
VDNLFNLFWLFIVISSLQPVIRQKMLEAARVRQLRALEQKRGSRVITLIHRQETLALLGFPLARYIDINDSEAVLRAIKLTGADVPIDMILHTPGGLVLAAEQIARALCRHKAKVTVFVPHYAMSGGTLIALAADEIVMDENAVLGPVDPQLGQYPAVSILKAVAQKDVNKVDDATLIQADMAGKAMRQVRQTVVDIVRLNEAAPAQAESIAEALSSGAWTHDYPISVDEARGLGLKISIELPTEVYQLMNLYPQAPQRRPSVDYIPVPYPLPERERGRREESGRQ